MPNNVPARWTFAVTARFSRFCGALVLAVLFGTATSLADPIDDRLEKADELKSVDYAQFESILNELGRDTGALSEHQSMFLDYLNAWRAAYGGDYATAIPQLRQIADHATDPTLRFRTLATIVNTLGIARRYEEAFTRLEDMLQLMPQITDPAARQQALGVAAFLYSEVGLVDLTIKYADQLAQENWAGRGTCRGGYLKLAAIYNSDRIKTVGPELDEVIDACLRIGDRLRANLVRTEAASFLLRQGKYESAFAMLHEHGQEVRDTRYQQLIAGHDALLARAYREMGQPALVEKHARRALEGALKDEHTEPAATAYRLLYLLARERGDTAAALGYFEKYAAADKGHLDELSARQLAYEKVKHQSLADELQIDALNRQNEVLQLQTALDKKAVETSRLYIALLILVAAFIAYFAFKTKRSQLHFKKLSQVDSLTSIANRPYFLAQAQSVLETCEKARIEVCVVLCDLDHFKAINDKYGHAAGDTALKETALAFRQHLRADDLFGRVGGEEFGILLPGCSLTIARERCELLRAELAELKLKHEELEMSISASFGIESTTACGYDLSKLLGHSDAALYKAKHAGRNRVVIYDASAATVFASMTETGRLRVAGDRFAPDLKPQSR